MQTDTPGHTGENCCLYNREQLKPVISAMAREAACLLENEMRPILVGILRRGAPLADMLHEHLAVHFNMSRVELTHIRIKRYNEALELAHPDTLLTETPEMKQLDLEGATVLLVDDVLYTGHSLLRAVDWLAHKKPARINTAVLVDRMVCQLPVHADITGLQLKVAPSDIIACHVPPYEKDFSIQLVQPSAVI